MSLPEKITKTDAAAFLGMTHVTFGKRIDAGAYSWPPQSWPALVAEHVAFEKAGHVVDLDDARFRRARADNHEIDAATKRGLVAPIDLFEEQVVAVFGLFVQETEGAEARLRRSAGVTPLAEAIRNEFHAFRDNLARGVERYCESLEERAERSETGAGARRRRVGADREDSAAGERGAGAV